MEDPAEETAVRPNQNQIRIKTRPSHDPIPIIHIKELTGFFRSVMETGFVLVTDRQQKFNGLAPLHGNPGWRPARRRGPLKESDAHRQGRDCFVASLRHLMANNHDASIGENAKTCSPFIVN